MRGAICHLTKVFLNKKMFNISLSLYVFIVVFFIYNNNKSTIFKHTFFLKKGKGVKIYIIKISSSTDPEHQQVPYLVKCAV